MSTWGRGLGRGPSAQGCGAGCGPHLPISRTIKTTFKFFSPALMSFIKRGGSLTPCILRQVRLRFRDPLGTTSHPPGPGAEPGATWGRAGDRDQEAVTQTPGKPASEAPSQKKK